MHHLLAGALAALALPMVALGLNLPLWVAVLVAGFVYGGAALLLMPKRAIDRVDPNRVGTAQAELVAGLIEDGERDVARLAKAAKRLRTASAAQMSLHMSNVAQSILSRLATEPGKLSSVRRFATYYLPRAADIAEGMALVESQRNADPRRLGEIADVMGKLDQAFTFYSDNFAQAELDVLDVELKLLSQSLTEDLNQPGRSAVAAPKAGA